MRRTLGTLLAPTLLVAGLLVGCGSPDDAGETTGTDSAAPSTSSPTSSPTASPTPDPTSTQTDGDAAEPVDYDVVAMPHAAAAGGRTSSMLMPVSTPDELDTFVSQLRREEFADRVRSEATEATYDGRLWAAIVSVGCDVPPGVFVEEGEAGYLVTPLKVVDPLEECFAPVTTVALVAIR